VRVRIRVKVGVRFCFSVTVKVRVCLFIHSFNVLGYDWILWLGLKLGFRLGLWFTVGLMANADDWVGRFVLNLYSRQRIVRLSK